MPASNGTCTNHAARVPSSIDSVIVSHGVARRVLPRSTTRPSRPTDGRAGWTERVSGSDTRFVTTLTHAHTSTRHPTKPNAATGVAPTKKLATTRPTDAPATVQPRRVSSGTSRRGPAATAQPPARGTATLLSTRSRTSSAVTPRSSASGATSIRWVRTMGARAFTSSGVT